MRLEAFRTTTAIALLALAGCAGTTTRDDGGARPRSVEEDMSRTGLANVRLAQTYLAAGKVELALDRANRALKSDPTSAEAHVVLAMIRERLGDRERAEGHYLRAAKYAPDEGYVLNATAAWLCQTGRPAEADAMFARATKDPFYKNRQQAYFNAGKCAADAGDLAKAEAYLRGGLAIAAEDTALLEQMVRVKVGQGDFMGARAFFQRREALGAPGPEMLALAARIEAGAGDAAAAERYRRQLQTEHPGYRPATSDGSRP